MLKFNFENEAVVVIRLPRNNLLTVLMLLLRVLNHTHDRVETLLVESSRILVLQIILVRISSCCDYISLLPCHIRLDIENILRDGLPLVSLFFTLNKNSCFIRPFSRFGKILDLKYIFCVLFVILDSEVEPLLVALRVSVDLHV